MARKPVWCGCLGLMCVLGLPTAAGAAHYKVVTKLLTEVDSPTSPFAADAEGNLYGEVAGMGSIFGQVFELTASSGYAAETILYSFTNVKRGADPLGGLTLDDNQIIGTADAGGVNSSGTVFNLGVPGQIMLTTLHHFDYKRTPNDAALPGNGLTAGPGGLFYGATEGGGESQSSGVVYSISDSITTPLYTVLHQFGGEGDGVEPGHGRLIWDGQSRLFGTTYQGGANGAGAVFMLEHRKAGWAEQVIYSFAADTDVNHPFYGVVMDSSGALYGCAAGGTLGKGGVFQLTPPSQDGDAWQETVLYNFGATPTDANASINDGGCGLTIDPTKKLIVGTSSGGGTYGSGTIWQLKPPTDGQNAWQEAVDHSFFSQRQGSGAYQIPPPTKVGKVYYGLQDLRGHVYAFSP